MAYIFAFISLFLIPQALVALDFKEIARKENLQVINGERQWLDYPYLSSLSGRVLFVGVQVYNSTLYTKVKDPELFETIDEKPHMAEYGSPFKHHVGNIMNLEPPGKYHHICFFGIFGFPRGGDYPGEKGYYFNTNEDVAKGLNKLDSMIEVGGTLQFSADYKREEFTPEYWLNVFRNDETLKKYKIITLGISSSNLIWWGQKLRA